jgi:hypothetical protein
MMFLGATSANSIVHLMFSQFNYQAEIILPSPAATAPPSRAWLQNGHSPVNKGYQYA